MSSSVKSFIGMFLTNFPQIYDKEGTREEPVWNEELQEEMVSPHQPRVYLPQDERWARIFLRIFLQSHCFLVCRCVCLCKQKGENLLNVQFEQNVRLTHVVKIRLLQEIHLCCIQTRSGQNAHTCCFLNPTLHKSKTRGYKKVMKSSLLKLVSVQHNFKKTRFIVLLIKTVVLQCLSQRNGRLTKHLFVLLQVNQCNYHTAKPVYLFSL